MDFSLFLWYLSDLFEDNDAVMAAKTKSIAHDGSYFFLNGSIGNNMDIARDIFIRFVQVNGSRNNIVINGFYRQDRFNSTGSSQ